MPSQPYRLGFYTLLLLVLLHGAYRIYDWRRVTNTRGWQAEQVFFYMAQPAVPGSPITRAAALARAAELITIQAEQQKAK